VGCHFVNCSEASEILDVNNCALKTESETEKPRERYISSKE
jgi:hypothetical protein